MGRRLIRVIIDEQFLFDIVAGRMKITNLPKDCRLKHLYFSPETLGTTFVIENDDFPLVKRGEIIPLFHAECEWIGDGTGN